MTNLKPTPPNTPPHKLLNEPIYESKTAIAKEIADVARNSISSYCMNVCGAKCCKVGKLLLQSDEEVETIGGSAKIGEHLNKKVLEKTQNGFMTYNLEQEPCRHLKESVLCSIHKSDKKPIICDDYPLFLTKKYVITSEQCPAVTNGKLDEYINQIEALGYKKF